MESIYEHGLPLRQIGQTLGCSESRVSQMHKSILTRLRARCSRIREQLAAVGQE